MDGASHQIPREQRLEKIPFFQLFWPPEFPHSQQNQACKFLVQFTKSTDSLLSFRNYLPIYTIMSRIYRCVPEKLWRNEVSIHRIELKIELLIWSPLGHFRESDYHLSSHSCCLPVPQVSWISWRERGCLVLLSCTLALKCKSSGINRLAQACGYGQADPTNVISPQLHVFPWTLCQGVWVEVWEAVLFEEDLYPCLQGQGGKMVGRWGQEAGERKVLQEAEGTSGPHGEFAPRVPLVWAAMLQDSLLWTGCFFQFICKDFCF